MNQDIFKKAKLGDKKAMDQLLAGLRSFLMGFLYYYLASVEEAQDLCQDLLLKFYNQVKEYETEEDLKTALVREALKRRQSDIIKEPWSSDAIAILQEEFKENKALEEKLGQTFFDYEEYFEIKAHMVFCLAVKLQSHFAGEKGLFILRDILNLDLKAFKETFTSQKNNLSREEEEIWEDLAQEYQKKCALLNPKSPCTQCFDLCAWLQGEEIVEKQKADLPFDKESDASEHLSDRLDYLQNFSVEKSLSRRFHQKLMDHLKHLLGQSGVEG